MRIKKIILITSKYLLIMTLIMVIVVCCIFLVYSKKLDYAIPERLNIEVVDNNGDVFLTLNNQNKQSYVPLSEIDQDVIDCIISIEDKRFYVHKGIDVKRMGGALFRNIKDNSLSEGASTITQQYARTLFLTTNKTYKRKLEEIAIAINLESKYTKDEILEGYLNTIYFDHGIYGIEDAAKFYFNKSCKNLTLAEAAILTAIPKGPVYYSPINNPENNSSRRNLIITEVYNDNKIDAITRDNAINEKVKIYGKIDKTSSANAPYYQDIIIKELKELNIASTVPYTIHTTLDSDLNNACIDALAKYFPEGSDQQIAIFAMNPQNGEVLTVIGGENYVKSTYNRATLSKRQPGSTIKPFLYYAALENGFTPITTFNSSATTFNVNNQEYSPHNYNDIYPDTDVTMAYALATSDNIYAVKTHLFLGTDVLYSTLHNFGFTTKINNNASLALGTSEVHLSELVNGYAKIASMGKNIQTKYITKIVDENGKILYQNNELATQKYNASSCYILAETMTNVFDNNLAINISVTGAGLKSMLTHKYAAKSGSTDTDNLMIGFNPEIVLGIWCGYDDNRIQNNSESRFIKYMWAEIMESHMKNKGNIWYSTPNDVTSIKLNPTTGKLAMTNEYSKNMYFSVDNIPWYVFDHSIDDTEAI